MLPSMARTWMFAPKVLEPRTTYLHLWSSWLFTTFWLAQISTLLALPLGFLVWVMLRSFIPEIQRWLARQTSLRIFLYLLNCVLCVLERRLYSRGKLSPALYFVSQAIKSAQIKGEIIGWVYYSPPKDIVGAIFYVLTFWGALIYATYVLIQWLRTRHGGITHANRINTADDLQATSPSVLKLVRWLDADVVLSSSLPETISWAMTRVIYGGKYVITAVPIIFLFSLQEGLAGEPSRATAAQTLPDSWNYPESDTWDTYRDSNENTDFRPRNLDEEFAETVRLQTVNGATHRDHIVLPVERSRQTSPEDLLTPRFLCFIGDSEPHPSGPRYVTRRVDNDPKAAEINYVFISYTRRQFYTQIPSDTSLSAADRRRFSAAAARDTSILIDFALAAAKEARVAAFWIDFECIRPEDDDADDNADIEEVYRICDIVRASHSMAIVLCPELDDCQNHTVESSRAEWLLDWGKRLWTVPEALLCPSEHRISIYSVGSATPEKVAKRNLPARVWNDAGKLRQLMDHYEASLRLTQLELISIALECLQRRQTEKRNAGDVAYALMGLLRLRPKVDKTDTDFQAFARLSIANDSDLLLERLICLSHCDARGAWFDLADQWDAKLWNLFPQYQVAGLAAHNTIIISNASGTRINWTPLYPIDFKRHPYPLTVRWAYMRRISRIVFVSVGIYYIYQYIVMAVVEDMISGDRGRNGLQQKINTYVQLYGGVWLIVVACFLPIPAFLVQHYRSKLDTTQARLFGIEGCPNLGQVEKLIFGANCGRLKWATPSIISGPRAPEDSRKQYTLVDTCTRTAHTFLAETHPTMLFVGANDRDTVRAILCSYDAVVGAFVKEAVVRLESAVSPRMQRMGRTFRFAITPAPRKAANQTERWSMDSDRISIPDIPEFRSLDD